MTQNGNVQEKDVPFIVPATRMFDEEAHIRVTMEMPGMKEDTLRVQIEKTFLSVSASDGENMFCTEITLPCPATLGRKKFNNDTLELILFK